MWPELSLIRFLGLLMRFQLVVPYLHDAISATAQRHDEPHTQTNAERPALARAYASTTTSTTAAGKGPPDADGRCVVARGDRERTEPGRTEQGRLAAVAVAPTPLASDVITPPHTTHTAAAVEAVASGGKRAPNEAARVRGVSSAASAHSQSMWRRSLAPRLLPLLALVALVAGAAALALHAASRPAVLDRVLGSALLGSAHRMMLSTAASAAGCWLVVALVCPLGHGAHALSTRGADEWRPYASQGASSGRHPYNATKAAAGAT